MNDTVHRVAILLTWLMHLDCGDAIIHIIISFHGKEIRDMDSKGIVQSAKESFEKILLNDKYSGIIKNDEHLHLLLSMLPIKGGDTILDVGTGAGYLAFPIAQSNEECKVIGLDIAEKVIEQNQLRAEAEHIDNVQFCSFDGMHYPFETESMDVITTRYAFHHFPDVKQAVEQLVSLLSNTGKILLSDPIRSVQDKNRVIDRFMKIKGDGHVGFYTQEELLDLFATYGMHLSESETTNMSFPFPDKEEYLALFDTLSDEEKALYDIHKKEGIVWVGEIDVANILFERRQS